MTGMMDKPDELDPVQEAWALAIHEALDAEPRSDMARISGHGYADGSREGFPPDSGYIDGDSYDLAGALRRAGWTPPPGVVEQWQQRLEG